MIVALTGLLVGFAVLLCFSCAKEPPPPATEVTVYPGGSEEREYSIAEIHLDNCQGTTPMKQVVEESISSRETLKLAQEITVQAGGSAQIPGIGGVNVGTEIARQVGVDYSEIESRTRSLELIAGPGTNMVFNVIRKDEIHRGKLVIQAGENKYETDYELIVSFWLESMPENLGCPDAPTAEEVEVVELRVDRVIISPDSLTLEKTEGRQLGLKVIDTNGQEVTNPEVFWDSLNPFVADVVGGWVTGHNVGTTEITASVEGVKGSVIVNVVKQSVHSVSVTPENITLEVGDNEQFSATVLNRRGNEITDSSIEWHSSDRSIAEFTPDGILSAKAAGTITIKATVEGVSYQTTVQVVRYVGSVTILADSIAIEEATIKKHETLTLTAVVKDTKGSPIAGQPVTWTTSSSSVATVSGNGVVTPVRTGTVAITAKADGKQDTVTVTIIAPVPEFDPAPGEFGPPLGTAGYVITLYGRNFDAPSLMVKFGGMIATIENITDTELRVIVPSGITGEVYIYVTTEYGFDRSERLFTIY